MALDVLIVALRDWSNVGFSFAKALQSVGVNAKAIKGKPHAFRYPEEAQLFENVNDAIELFDQAKAILFMHTNMGWRPPKLDISKKFKVVFHGGTQYRRNPVELNNHFNPKVDATIIQTADLLNLGACNEHWIMPPVDLDKIPFNKKLHKPLIVGHYPRDPEFKGTAVIDRVLLSLKNDKKVKQFNYLRSTQPLQWKENLNRMAECDIYIESQHYVSREGRPIYQFGVTALEAAALGCIVTTSWDAQQLYEEHFGECPIVAANSQDELYDALKGLVGQHRNKLIHHKKRMRRWIEEQHSYRAVGEHLKVVFAPVL